MALPHPDSVAIFKCTFLAGIIFFFCKNKNSFRMRIYRLCAVGIVLLLEKKKCTA